MFDRILEPCKAELSAAQKLLDQILKPQKVRTEQNTLKPYNEMQIHLDAANSLAGLISQVHPDANIREEAEQCEQLAHHFMTDLSLSEPLYNALKGLNTKKLSKDAQRLVTNSLRDFKRSGIDKDLETRNKIKALEEKLVVVGQSFGRNIRDDRRFVEIDASSLKGMPADYIASHPVQENGKVKISTDYPDFIPFMSYADDAKARKDIWMQFNQRGYPANEAVLKDLLTKRYELAQLLGYSSFADYVVEDKMVKSTVRAKDFIDQIAAISKDGARQEYAVILAEKRKTDPKATEVYTFERAYLEEKIKQQKYQVDSQVVRSHFHYPKVRNGLLGLTSNLFDVQFKRVDKPAVWDPSVEVYDVYNGKKLSGRVYLDMHPRDNKFKHAAQFTIRNGVKGKQIPEGALVCNFSEDLMDHDQVVTFFHEFGHLMHHVLGGNQKWVHFSGVSTEWDFVEAPSQFFEEWAWDPKVLRTFSDIPLPLIAKMKAADEFGKGLDARRQMFLAQLSLQFYLQDPTTFDPLALMKELQGQYSEFPYVDGTYLHLSFGHLHDYSAMYYTYMWSKVIAKDLASAFEKKGLMDKTQAKRYKKLILEKGGSKDADELVEGFLGRPYQFEAFKKWIELPAQT
ncbi:MAG: M3 family metallopeptidase [Myxococcota bacterium]